MGNIFLGKNFLAGLRFWAKNDGVRKVVVINGVVSTLIARTHPPPSRFSDRRSHKPPPKKKIWPVIAKGSTGLVLELELGLDASSACQNTVDILLGKAVNIHGSFVVTMGHPRSGNRWRKRRIILDRRHQHGVLAPQLPAKNCSFEYWFSSFLEILLD